MFTTKLWAAGLVALGLADPTPAPAGGADASPAPAAGTDRILLRRCSMDYAKSSLLGSPLVSVLQDCLVQPGDRLRAGQVLGRIQDREVRAELELRRIQAESDVEVRLSEAKHAEAVYRLKVSDNLRSRNALSRDQYNVERLAVSVLALEVESAANRRRVAQMGYEQAKAALRAREITAPHDGVVVAVYRRQGESVTPNAPVFHLADVDRVWVTGHLDVNDAWRVERGQTVEVSPVIGGADLEIEHRVFPGRIIFVDQIVDPKSQTCKVVAEVDNRAGLLRAGLGARMAVLPPPTSATAAPRERAGPGQGRGAGPPAAAGVKAVATNPGGAGAGMAPRVAAGGGSAASPTSGARGGDDSAPGRGASRQPTPRGGPS